MFVNIGATTGDKNLAEFSWVGIGTTVSFIKYSTAEFNVGLGTLTLNVGVGETQIIVILIYTNSRIRSYSYQFYH